MQKLVLDVMDARLVDLLTSWRESFSSPDPIDDPVRRFAVHADHLLVINAEGTLNRYAHYGAAFVSHFGTDLTNEIIDLLPAEILPAEHRGMLEFEYNFARRVQRPLWRSYTAAFEGGRVETWQRLVLPAGAEQLIVGAYPVHLFQDTAPAQDIGTPRGLLRLVIERVPVILDSNGDILDLALSLKAFSDTRQHVAELEVLATRDSLTGVANLRHFRHLAALELDHARLMGRSFSLLALDLDHFKRINDSFGHAAGDAALQAFVAACQIALREYDILGRCGGEEFAVALPNTGPDGAMILADRLRQQVEQVALGLPDGDTVRFTVSIGVATTNFADPARAVPDVAALSAQADAALYRAKALGRNRVFIET